MKYLIIFLAFISLTSCYTQKTIYNRQAKDSKGKYFMIGRQNREAFLHENYAQWFQQEYDSYKPNPTIVEELKRNLKSFKIKVFYGTWCGDSRREVPRFLKILDEAGVRKDSYELYAVDTNKESFYGEEQGLNILYVPTFIFYDNSNVTKSSLEINRIIESPSGETLEEDILKIVTKQPYTPNYYY